MLRRTLLISLLMASGTAFAHPGDHAGGLMHGFAHPFLGLDHLLAMVIVGVWAARTAQRVWLLPAVFVCFMAIGAAFGQLPLPFVEPMILLSVLCFGLATILAKRLSPWIGVPMVAVFALYHGHAHFTEMPDTSTPGYLVGMLLATASLHLAGVIAMRAATRLQMARAAS